MSSTKIFTNALSLLCCSRVEKGMPHTHTTMGDTKGIYDLDRKSLDLLFDLHANDIKNKNHISSILEKPRKDSFTMLRVDIDNKKKLSESDSRTPSPLYTIDEPLNLITQIQDYLRDNLSEFNPNTLDCVFLSKPPYISVDEKKNETYLKHGYHLQFPYCFLSEKDNCQLATHFKSIFPGFDVIHTKTWLMYGCQKSKSSGRYTAELVVGHNRKHHKPEIYFKNYEVYDQYDRKIKFEKEIPFYYPRILSIMPGSRDIVEFKITERQQVADNKEQIERKNMNDRDANLYKDEIRDKIVDYIENVLDNAFSTEDIDISESLIKLKRTDDYTCPLSGWRHVGNRPGYFLIQNGKIKFGCNRNECFYSNDNKKNICIGSYKEQKQEQIVAEVEEIDTKEEKKTKKIAIIKSFADTNIKSLFNISNPLYKRVVKSTEKYVDKNDFRNKEKCVIVKAGLGKGKTYASIEYINEEKYDSIIILTPRKTYARCCFERMKENSPQYDWKMYLNEKKRMIKHPFIICQAESMNRLEINKDKKTLVVIDEIEAFLCQLTCIETNKNNIVDNIDVFLYCLKNASKIICLDAFISPRSLDFIISQKIPFSFFDYTSPLINRTCLRFDKRSQFNASLVDDLDNNKKIFFFCSAKTKQHMFLENLRERYPEKKILFYNSETKEDCKNLTQVNSIWTDYDIVCCTSCITVGCNFDAKHFDRVYCYASAPSRNYVRDIFQALYRVRHLTDNKLVFCLDEIWRGPVLDTDKKVIQSDLKSKINNIETQFRNHFKMDYTLKTPDWLSKLIVYNEFEHNVSIMNMGQLFDKYLKECNYADETIDDEFIFEVDFDEVKETPAFSYDDIPSITSDQMKELRKKKQTIVLTDLEKATLDKFWFQYCVLDLKKEVEQPIWEIYNKFGKGKFKNLCVEKGMERTEITISDIFNTGLYAGLNDGFTLRVDAIRNICKLLGINSTQRYGTQVSRQKMEETVAYFKENKEEFKKIFKTNKSRSKQEFGVEQCQDLINQIFEKWGYSKLQKEGDRKRGGTKKNRIDDTPYVLVNKQEVDIYDYIKPKKSYGGVHLQMSDSNVNPLRR